MAQPRITSGVVYFLHHPDKHDGPVLVINSAVAPNYPVGTVAARFRLTVSRHPAGTRVPTGMIVARRTATAPYVFASSQKWYNAVRTFQPSAAGCRCRR